MIRRFARTAALVSVFLPALIVAGDSESYEISGLRWPHADVTWGFFFPAGNAPTDRFDRAFASAATEWSDRTGFVMSTEPRGLLFPCLITTHWPPGYTDAKWSEDICGDGFGNLGIAVTWRPHSSFDGTIRNVVIFFDINRNWDLYGGPWQSGRPDFRRVALHEIGHGLGLDHEFDVPSIMAAPPNPFTFNVERVMSDDVAGVLAIYPELVPEPSGVLTQMMAVACLSGLSALRRNAAT